MIHRIDSASVFGVPPGSGIEAFRVAEARIADALGALDPLEQQSIDGASTVRVHEFTAGRCLARVLLKELGADRPVVLRARDRSPVWPVGFVGSIAHTQNMCIVVVARASHFESIGVDAEPEGLLEDDLVPEITTERERVELGRLSGKVRAHQAQRLFVAKEAVYKCLHPIDQEFLRFQDVEVEFTAPFAGAEAGSDPRSELSALVPFRAHCVVSPSRSDTRLVGVLAAGSGLVRAFAFVPTRATRS